MASSTASAAAAAVSLVATDVARGFDIAGDLPDDPAAPDAGVRGSQGPKNARSGLRTVSKIHEITQSIAVLA